MTRLAYGVYHLFALIFYSSQTGFWEEKMILLGEVYITVHFLIPAFKESYFTKAQCLPFLAYRVWLFFYVFGTLISLIKVDFSSWDGDEYYLERRSPWAANIHTINVFLQFMHLLCIMLSIHSSCVLIKAGITAFPTKSHWLLIFLLQGITALYEIMPTSTTRLEKRLKASKIKFE